MIRFWWNDKKEVSAPYASYALYCWYNKQAGLTVNPKNLRPGFANDLSFFLSNVVVRMKRLYGSLPSDFQKNVNDIKDTEGFCTDLLEWLVFNGDLVALDKGNGIIIKRKKNFIRYRSIDDE